MTYQGNINFDVNSETQTKIDNWEKTNTFYCVMDIKDKESKKAKRCLVSELPFNEFGVQTILLDKTLFVILKNGSATVCKLTFIDDVNRLFRLEFTDTSKAFIPQYEIDKVLEVHSAVNTFNRNLK